MIFMMMSRKSNAIAEYKEAGFQNQIIFEVFGGRSQEAYDSQTRVIAAQREIERLGLQREAGMTYANSWD